MTALVSLVVLAVVLGAVAPAVVMADDDGHGNECDGDDESNPGGSSGVADSGTENWQRTDCSDGDDGGETPNDGDSPGEEADGNGTDDTTGTDDGTASGGGSSGGADSSMPPSGGGSNSDGAGNSMLPETSASASDGGDSNDGATDESGTGDDAATDAGADADESDDGGPEPELNAERNEQAGTPSGDVELSAGAIWWLFLLALLALLLTGGAVYRYYFE